MFFRLSVLDDTTLSNLFALTPKTTTSIRWNAKYQSIRSIFESIDEILQALDMITAGELLIQTIKLLETERSNEINLNNLIITSEKLAKKYGIDPESEFNRKHRRRRPPRRLDDNPQTTYQFTRYGHFVK